jgi:hypothetical protein
MARIHVFKILQLGDDEKFHTVAESFYETDLVPMRADRELQSQANTEKKTADTTGATAGEQAQQEGSQLRTQLEQRAEGHGTGFDQTDLNNMLVAQQQAAGGANAAITGEGKLSALRTRGTAGGIAPALAEAARSKERILSEGALGVANQNAALKQAQQAQALQQLQGLYGTDTSNQLRAMGLSEEAIQNELAAGRQGWVQNTNQAVASLGGGKGIAALTGA